MGEACNVSQRLSTHNLATLLNHSDVFLIDCDGVIWKGDKLIDGVPETLDMLRSMGKKLVFVTNNSTKSRRKCLEKFRKLGMNVTEDEIFCSCYAAAMYLKYINFPPEKKVYVVGHEGIMDELQLAGYEVLGGPEDRHKITEVNSNSLIEQDKSVGAVVVGVDLYINYYKLQYATICIRENPGCHFIATNRDPVGYITELQQWPGGGCIVAALCGSTEREPFLVGKPSTFMMDFFMDQLQIDKSRMCMVGDRLDTDVLFGKNTGCTTLLVLSGITTLPVLQDPSNDVQPDYYTNQLPDILKFLPPLAVPSVENKTNLCLPPMIDVPK